MTCEITKGTPIFILTARKILKESTKLIPTEILPVVEEFFDVFPGDVPDNLPPHT